MTAIPILAVDIGNTNTVCAVCTPGRIGKMHRCSSVNQTPATIRSFLDKIAGSGKTRGAVLCSVVPTLNGAWEKELTFITGNKPLVVGHYTNLGIKIDYPNPAQIGPDRLANATGAAGRFGVPAIVLDFGTAVTIDVVSGKGAYCGGVIMPGLALMSDYLHERTALLPQVDFFREIPRKLPAIGTSTEHAMFIGALTGFRGMIREVAGKIRKELGAKRIHMCATGGHAALILKDSGMRFKIDPKLTLRGLYEIYGHNREFFTRTSRNRR